MNRKIALTYIILCATFIMSAQNIKTKIEPIFTNTLMNFDPSAKPDGVNNIDSIVYIGNGRIVLKKVRLPKFTHSTNLNVKTTLKGVEDMEDLYMQSKQYINSLFGMMVTAVVQPNVTYDNETGSWQIQELTDENVTSRLEKLSNTKYANEKRYFLSYSWGCWVTAYARRNLWKCIIPNDEKVLYCDTDSIFVVGEHDFKWYNDEVTAKLKSACEYHNLDFNKTRPKTPKGKEKPLGIFDK